MKWSKFNYIYKSKKHGYFIYNAVTNSFLRINEELYGICRMVESDFTKISLIDLKIQKELVKAKILTTEYDDENYIIQAKYLKRLRSFNQTSLGLVIAPTYTCNFACPYCYEENLPNIHMSEAVEDNIITFIKSFEIAKELLLCWHGGEPLLRFDSIKNILSKIRSTPEINLTQHHLVTNGYLLDEYKCDFFREHNLASVQITIDGLAATHNINRKHKSGVPTFDTIIKNIDYIVDNLPDCKVILRVNVHDGNKDEYPELRKFILDKWGDRNIYYHFRYAKSHGKCQVACLENKNKLQFAIDLYKRHNIKEIEFYPIGSNLGGCTADSNNSFVIGPKGELYKCWVDVGKKDREIGSITESTLNLPLISEYLVGTDKFNDAKCTNCFLFPVCDGGCSIYRQIFKQTGKEYDVCPINPGDLGLILDLYFEQYLNSTPTISNEKNKVSIFC